MSRPKKLLKRTFTVFCEGDTEYNYVKGLKQNDKIRLTIKQVNMHGGGYSNFLSQVKKDQTVNSIAKFIIIDYDRVNKHSKEKGNLIELINYCKIKNKKKGSIPHFLIIDNPDFEYLSCLHIPSYSKQNPKVFIEKILKFGDIENFKSNKNIYSYLNSNSNSQVVMLSKLNTNKILKNSYSITKSQMEVRINNTFIEWDNASVKGSNINEFFELIDWK